MKNNKFINEALKLAKADYMIIVNPNFKEKFLEIAKDNNAFDGMKFAESSKVEQFICINTKINDISFYADLKEIEINNADK